MKGDRPEKRYRFVIEFGLHCFTRGLNTHKGEKLHHVKSDLLYSDSRETRIFCFKRYSLSYQLPDIVKRVGDRPCFHTGKGNFFVVELMDDEGEIQEYEVYFQVSRERRGLLRLFVQSAYIRDNEHNSSQPKKKKIGFFVIAHNMQVNKPVKSLK